MKREAPKLLPLLLLLLGVMAIAGCNTNAPTFEVDHAPDYDFAAVQSYRWYDDMVDSRQADYRQYNSSDKRIRDAVKRELARHNIAESSSRTADIWINYSVSKHQQTVERTTGYDRGVHGGASVGTYGSAVGIGYSTGPSVKVYKEGTAVLDIIDVRTRKVVWRGVAEGRMKGDQSISDKQRATVEVVRELFKNFPPEGVGGAAD